MASEIKDNRFFPNGFESWVRTHHIVVTNMHVLAPSASDMAYEIGMKIADEFELKHRGAEWKAYHAYRNAIKTHVANTLPSMLWGST